MFDKFGEFDSFSEINELAENLLNEGDIESLKVVAKENGIQADFVDLYTNGEIPELCDKLTAALGKIDVEAAELKPKEIMEDWVEYLRGQCMENELLAHNVRKKGKTLKGCIAAILMWSFKNQQTVDKDIIKAAGTRTWQNHFGGDNEAQENEPTGEHTTAETPEPEDDNAAVGEAGTDEVKETESGSVADNEPAPGAGKEQKDDSTDGDTDCREDNREPADRPEKQTGEKSLGEQIGAGAKIPTNP